MPSTWLPDLDELLADLSLPAIGERLVRWLCTELPSQAASFLVASEGREALEVVAALGLRPDRGIGCRIPWGHGVTGLAAARQEPVWVPRVADRAEYIAAVPGATWEYAMPVLAPEGCIAVLDAESGGPPPASAARERALRHLRAWAPALRVAIALYHAERRARHDPLTGLLHAGYLRQQLPHLCQEASEERPLAAVMLDLDHFKEVNDAYGHLLGDAILHRVGEVLRLETGLRGLAARYGGDEFTLLLPGTPAAAALEVAERIRAAVGRIDLLRVSCSAGVATMPPAPTPEALLDLADRALYEAKRRGRDRCVLAPVSGPVWASRAQWRGRDGGVPAFRGLPGGGKPIMRFMPVVETATGRTWGYEACLHAVGRQAWPGPRLAFDWARQHGQASDLDLACCRAAWASADGLGGRALLLNVQARTLFDPAWRRWLGRALQRPGAPPPEAVVLELHRRREVSGLEVVCRALRRAVGPVRIAFDNFGEEPGDLVLLGRVRPDYLKTDPALAPGVSRDPARRALVRGFHEAALAIGSALIVQGVDEASDLETLREMGVPYVQGELVGPSEPAGPLPTPRRR